jgi:hypothetical protein
MVKNVESKEMYLKLYNFLKKTIRHYAHIINKQKFNWRNLPMSTSTSTSMSLSVSMSMDTDRDRDMDMDTGRWTRTGGHDVDVGMGRCPRTGTWTWTWTWADEHGQGHGRGRGHWQIQIGSEKHEQFAVIILHVDLLPENFCRGDVLLGDVLLQGDVLLPRRFVEETFC